ncbi:MAG: apolipoprotein N-acyltransferase [Clostridia bacterium]|nr:apolipoprotein N-acyltransferase [Clostridia bacterium]
MTYLVVFVCGILTSLPLIFDFLAFLPWFSLIPLFFIAEKKKSAYRHGLVFSLGYYGVLYYWFTYLYPLDFAGFSNSASVLLIIVAWLGLSLLQGIGTAFIPFIYRRLIICDKPYFAPLAAACLWCIGEWLQTKFWFGVPWGRLAVTQYKILPVIQSASILGSLFVGFLIVLVNGLLLIAIKKFRENKRVPLSAYIALALVFSNLAFGFVRLSFDGQKDSEKTITAASIQGNIASGDKWADDSLSNSLKVYSELTETAVKETGSTLIAWPETVLTISISENEGVRNKISELSKKLSAYIAVGAFYSEKDSENNEKTYNSIYLFHPDGTVNESVYSKRRLVPFGEFLPMPNLIKVIFPFLAEMNMFDDNLSAGEGPSLFETEHGKIGGLVCFDSIYETLTLNSVREGAELFVLSTNDSWYLDSAAVYQHNGHAVLRAVESGRDIVRAANTGISSIISKNGEIKAQLPPLVSGYVSEEVTLSSERTLYSYVGNIIVFLSFAYILVLSFFKVRAVLISKRHLNAIENEGPL